MYIEKIEDIAKAIRDADEKTIVVVFSAGDIDYGLRSLDFRV